MELVEDKSKCPATNNQGNPNFKISHNHENSQKNHGILEKNLEPKNDVSTTTGKKIAKNIIGTESSYGKNTTNVHYRKTSNKDNSLPYVRYRSV